MLFLLDLFFPVLALRFKVIKMLWLLVFPKKYVFMPVENIKLDGLLDKIMCPKVRWKFLNMQLSRVLSSMVYYI